MFPVDFVNSVFSVDFVNSVFPVDFVNSIFPGDFVNSVFPVDFFYSVFPVDFVYFVFPVDFVNKILFRVQRKDSAAGSGSQSTDCVMEFLCCDALQLMIETTCLKKNQKIFSFTIRN